ncbi:unnamed protein product, partial [Prorocentrum cordatum]
SPTKDKREVTPTPPSSGGCVSRAGSVSLSAPTRQAVVSKPSELVRIHDRAPAGGALALAWIFSRNKFIMPQPACLREAMSDSIDIIANNLERRAVAKNYSALRDWIVTSLSSNVGKLRRFVNPRARVEKELAVDINSRASYNEMPRAKRAPWAKIWISPRSVAAKKAAVIEQICGACKYLPPKGIGDLARFLNRCELEGAWPWQMRAAPIALLRTGPNADRSVDLAPDAIRL